MRSLALAAALASTLLAPHLAEACSALPCVEAVFYPGEGDTIPANAPVLLYRASARSPNAAPPLALVDANGTSVGYAITENAFPVGGWAIAPDAPLAPGAYTLRSDEVCFDEPAGAASTFTVGPAAMLPTALGNLAGTDVRRGELAIEASAQCTELVSTVSVPLTLTLDATAQPWAPLLMYRTLVDGQLWRPRASAPEVLPLGGSWRGRGQDEIYAHCEPLPPGTANYGLSQGDHTVVMEATLPGTAISIQTPPLQVTLRCATSGVDAGGVDGFVPVDDGGASPPPAADAGADTLVEGSEGCRGAGPGRGAPVLGLFALALLAGRRRRRRAACAARSRTDGRSAVSRSRS